MTKAEFEQQQQRRDERGTVRVDQGLTKRPARLVEIVPTSEPCRCRRCQQTKTIADMAICSWKIWGEWTGVCLECCRKQIAADLAAEQEVLGVETRTGKGT